jgi:flagellar biogenesis protein FliO
MKQGSFFWSRVFGMLFALGVVVIAIFVALRWAAQRMGVYTPSKDKQMVIRDRLSLEQKKGLYLVELAGQSYLLATHEQGVTLLDKRPTDALQHKDAPIPTQFEVVSDGSSQTTQQE